jgi:hypothetical protein
MCARPAGVQTAAGRFDGQPRAFLFFAANAFRVFSLTRNRTIRSINSTGKGFSSGN